jgi:hypothetical protein
VGGGQRLELSAGCCANSVGLDSSEELDCSDQCRVEDEVSMHVVLTSS